MTEQTANLRRLVPVLNVGNYLEVCRHYCRGLGFKIAWEARENAQTFVIAVERGGCSLMLQCSGAEPRTQPSNQSWNVVYVADLYKLEAEFIACGDVSARIHSYPPMNIEQIHVRDHWQNLLVFEQDALEQTKVDE